MDANPTPFFTGFHDPSTYRMDPEFKADIRYEYTGAPSHHVPFKHMTETVDTRYGALTVTRAIAETNNTENQCLSVQLPWPYLYGLFATRTRYFKPHNPYNDVRAAVVAWSVFADLGNHFPMEEVASLQEEARYNIEQQIVTLKNNGLLAVPPEPYGDTAGAPATAYVKPVETSTFSRKTTVGRKTAVDTYDGFPTRLADGSPSDLLSTSAWKTPHQLPARDAQRVQGFRWGSTMLFAGRVRLHGGAMTIAQRQEWGTDLVVRRQRWATLHDGVRRPKDVTIKAGVFVRARANPVDDPKAYKPESTHRRVWTHLADVRVLPPIPENVLHERLRYDTDATLPPIDYSFILLHPDVARALTDLYDKRQLGRLERGREI